MTSRPYFEEVQKFRDNAWIWVIVIAVSLSSILPLANGLYWQLYKGEPWGNEPLSNNGIIMVFSAVVVSLGIAAAMILLTKLEMKIDHEGIHYRFVPIKQKWQLITKDQIAEYKLVQRFKLFQSGGFGHHRNRLTKTRSFRIQGGKHLYLRLHNGEKLLLGTQNLEGIDWAMKKLMTINEPI
jgi:hypothetical protein